MPISTQGLTSSIPGVFTNTQMNLNRQSLVNSLSPNAQFHVAQGAPNINVAGTTQKIPYYNN